MRCPDCQTEIPDGSLVCPNCDSVLEAAIAEMPLDELWNRSAAEILTSAKSTQDADAEVARKAVARSSAARRGPTSSPRPPARSSELAAAPPSSSSEPPQPSKKGRSFGPASQAQIATHLVATDPEAARGTQIVDLSLPAVVRQLAVARKAKEREAGKAERADKAAKGKPAIGVEESWVTQGIDELMGAARLLYARMHRIDRWTIFVLAVAFVSAFLPWSHVRGEGLLAGIQEYGAISVGLSVLTFLCIYARTVRRRLAGLVIVFQILVAAGLTAVPVLRIVMAGGEIDFSVGLYLSGVGGIAVEVLTLMRLARLST